MRRWHCLAVGTTPCTNFDPRAACPFCCGPRLPQAVQLQQQQPVIAPSPPPPSGGSRGAAPSGAIPAPVPPPASKGPTPRTSKSGGTTSKASARRPAGAITMRTLVDAGLLIPGVRVLYVDYKGSSTYADLNQEGQIHHKGGWPLSWCCTHMQL
jgi:hypothetical protein